MKSKIKKIHQALIGILLLLFIVGSSIPFLAYTKTDAAVLHANCDDGTIKVYVKGLNSKDDEDEAEELLIGKRECRHLKSYDMEDDEQIVHTLILIANAKTVEVPDRKKTKKLISSIVDNHTDDEQFRIATFGTKLTYFSEFSDDYTSVERLLDTLKFKSKDVHFAQMLSEAMDDLADEGFTGYTRIIVFAPGMNDEADGMAAEQLNDKLDEYRYPIYTFGYEEADNGQALQDMYMLSDMTGAGDYDLTATDDFEPVLKTLREDYTLQVFEASIPAKSRNGSVRKVKLTLRSGDILSFSLMMPQEKKGATADIAESPILLVGTMGAAVIIVILILLLFFGRKNKKPVNQTKESAVNDDIVTEPPKDTPPQGSDPFITKGWGGTDNQDITEQPEKINTVMVWKADMQKNDGGKTVFLAPKHIIVTDCKDGRSIFEGDVQTDMLVGRSRDADIRIVQEDKSVGREHCLLHLENEKLWVLDNGSVNGTLVNDRIIEKDRMEELHSGDILTLGNTNLRIEL